MTSTEDLPDDYFSSVAEVVEAARELDEAKRKEAEASEVHIQRHAEMRQAERALREALDKLKGVGVGRRAQDGDDDR